ncbi:glutamine synthetase [Marinitoga sp. 1135]|uniref:Glutamine synthetase n=1 Tax=Marinitoga piezophila (strain DSM 14283 / JCM 11233 / KA3) TaxID=443254 RepID=H2J5K0_MARPK|nr:MULTISPECIES: type I glutamate--ammonia ligase [Marinitoga]AEX86144.1 glutamine synthetase, type I [Marinitoga piezophila KA3]APT76559.1 glutamine synthetase [Marinitoga sp. 1137]NUU96328.1 glutamine synthetase [Marinitoga sp. 1135]NUU98246.1 glutamine synthetase [Marinitoga sp. 1138]
MNHEDVLRIVEAEKVKFIRLQITDINGLLKNVEIPWDELKNSFEKGTMFDGSSIEGFVRIEESDMYLKPDPETFAIYPWTDKGYKSARIICDVYTADGKPFEGDPRYRLKKVLSRLKEHGYEGFVGPEPEFFLLPKDPQTHKPILQFLDNGGYFDLLPIDQGEETRKDIVLALEDMGINVEASHHEVAPSQHEIDFTYDEALKTADNIQTFKLVVKTIALLRGLHATFMPKPFFGVNGSGMHTHLSLFKDGKNIFFDPENDYELSDELKYFVAGVLKHIKAITAIANPTINSYKRLVPGYEAPVNIAWSPSNRSALIRVPAARGKGTRIEVRSPDPTANSYLLLAALFAAGFEGIQEKLEPPKPVISNIYHMTPEERDKIGIDHLPGNLKEAIEELKKDELMKEVLGEHIFEKYIEMKEHEWKEFSINVTDWEINKYLWIM